MNRKAVKVAALTAVVVCALGGVALGGAYAAGQRRAVALLHPLGVPGRWRLVMNGAFAGSTLNRRQWSTTRGSGNPSMPFDPGDSECFDSRQVSVSRGSLVLGLAAIPQQCGGVLRPYRGGLLQSRTSFRYGFMQARVWLPASGAGVADWPAFWAVGPNWPAGGEIDVVEGLEGQACWHFHNPAGAPGGCSTWRYSGRWHVFGADWEPGVVRWYYDGRHVATLSSGVTDAPMTLILDLAGSVAPTVPVVTPSLLRVSYVRLWQHA